MKSSPPSPSGSRLIASSTAVWVTESIGGSYPDSVEQETTQASWRRGSYREKLQRTFPSCTVLQRSFTWTGASFAVGTFRNLRSRRARLSRIGSQHPGNATENMLVLVFLLILLQAVLIIGLLWQRARNRKADLRLRESEKRFRLMADTTPALIWMCDKEGTVTYLNDRRINFTGRDSATGFEDAWSAFIHPDDVQSVQAANKRALEQQKEFSKEYRLRRRDGVYRWMLDIAAPRVNEDGSFAGFVGSAADITDQKLAQEALEKIGGKLIEAQEEERSRIARELHDDICQRLALLSMELEQANRGSNGSGQLAEA